MRYLSQRNIDWASEKLGMSKLTLGRFGCTTTCVSMLSDYFGAFVSPVALAHNANLYTNDGLFIWKNFKNQKMKFVRRSYGEDRGAIIQAMKGKDSAVILQVNDGQHWVVGVRPTYLGKDYVIVDPWDGRKRTLKSAYKNVTGAAFFARS